MGRLIPAGTGLAAYKSLNIVIDGEAIEPDQSRYQPQPVPQPSPSQLAAVNEE